jgi:predicted transcriptional regulator
MYVLTRRQKEFLEIILDLHERTGSCVHYTEVADLLNVSKWTAYDVMNSLAKRDLLDVKHDLERRERPQGRSMVLHAPTHKAYEALGLEKEVREDWPHIRAKLLEKVVLARETGVGRTIKETLAEITRLRSPFLFCAYMIVLLVLVIAAVKKTAEGSTIMVYLMSTVAAPDLALLLFAGATLAFALGSPQHHHNSLAIINGLVGDYEANLRRVDASQKRQLLEFAQEAGGLLRSHT